MERFEWIAKFKILTNFDLELIAKASELEDEEYYQEACNVYNVIIDDYKSYNPSIRYKRALWFMKMGKEYLGEARLDLQYVKNYWIGKTKLNSAILRIKAEHTNGLLEIQYGWDMERAKYHFLSMLNILSNQSYYQIRREFPGVENMKASAKKHFQ